MSSKEKAALAVQVESAPRKFPAESYRKQCKMLGLTDIEFTAAIRGLKGEYTLEDMKAKAAAWKKARVLPAVKEAKK